MSDDKRDDLIVEINTTLLDLKHQLLGNGQPGIIQKHEKQLEALKENAARGRGALAVILFLITLVGGSEILHIFGKF